MQLDMRREAQDEPPSDADSLRAWIPWVRDRVEEGTPAEAIVRKLHIIESAIDYTDFVVLVLEYYAMKYNDPTTFEHWTDPDAYEPLVEEE